MTTIALTVALAAFLLAFVTSKLATATADLLVELLKDDPEIKEAVEAPKPVWFDMVVASIDRVTRWAWVATGVVGAAGVAIVLYRVVAP